MQLDIENLSSSEKHDDETARLEIRMALIRIMQDRTKKIPSRLLDIGRELKVNHEAMETIVSAENSLQLEVAIVKELDEHSNALREYGERALEFFSKGDGQYVIAASRFESNFPDYEIRFENILVNQMFFSQFPFGMNSNSACCEFMGLYVTYILMRFLCIGNLVEEPSDERFVDLCAALFRLVSHTDFGRTVTAILSSI